MPITQRRRRNLIKKKVILASSTHPGEEELMIKLANLLRKNALDNVLIIIAPRHIRRSMSIQNRVKSAGFDIKCRSKGDYPSKNDKFYLSSDHACSTCSFVSAVANELDSVPCVASIHR